MHLNTFIHDLIDNTSFRKWVLSDFEVDDDIWSVFIDEHENNQVDINIAIRLVRELEVSKEDVPVFSSDETWSKIQKSIGISDNKPIYTGGTIWKMYFNKVAVAAAFIGFISFLWLMNQSGNLEISSRTDEMLAHQLPDGSRVILNRQSGITYHPEKWQTNREVQLEGEALFEVKKGSKFKVKTSEGEVEVLGTSFNVYSRERQLSVTCYTGKVAVRNASDDVVLLPGQEVFQDQMGNLAMLKKPVPDDKSPWINNLIRFNEAPLYKVIKDLNLYYGEIYTIDAEVANEKFTGILPSDSKLKALENLTWALGLKHKISKEGKYYIYR